jgi:hypothetical protein
MGSYLHSMLFAQFHRMPHDHGVAGMEAAGQIGRRDVFHQLFVVPQLPVAEAFPHIGADVDFHHPLHLPLISG